MNKTKKYQVAEQRAKETICGEKCVCPKVKAAGACGSCAVLASLREYYETSEIGILDDYSWDEIAEIAESGKAAEKFNIGDEKTCVLYTGEEVTFVILGFGHDDLVGGGKAGITFGLKDVLGGRFEMNAEYTNEGGWKDSKMRTVYMRRFYTLLPEGVRKHIKFVSKTTSVGGGSVKPEKVEDKLFLFSECEVFGDNEYAAPNEGSQYPYFEDEDNRIKNRNASATFWWLRSPYASISNLFCCVSYDGVVSGDFADGSYGVCFGFCF